MFTKNSEYEIYPNLDVIQNSTNTLYAKRVAEEFRESKNFLKINGFSRSIKNLQEDIEN